MLQVTFPEIVQILSSAGSTVAAAEAHGTLCGALCSSPDYPPERWFEELLADDGSPASDEDTEALRLLYSDTVSALRGQEMLFEPLLPDEDRALEERAAAISQWCYGFLYGFGTGRSPSSEALPSNVDEILRDFSEIGRATVDTSEVGDAGEEAYAEVFEYVRVGVQLIHDELADEREAAAGRDS